MQVTLRRLCEDDSFEDITALVHSAYSELAKMGLRFLATHQDASVTKERCMSGVCLLAEYDGNIVGTVTFYDSDKTGGCSWYDQAGVASFGQFAVLPTLQRMGIGRAMLSAVEELAWQSGAHELALDTAEGAKHLIGYYERRGYRYVGIADWEETNYTSVVMSKPNPNYSEATG